ncbi:polyhydroxyalkanoic acid system family protein [Terasakiella sp. SH-1]|uniref:polyhydroxyalkanoic acid system family protein n=1 Tax=Terasakiella sp. SH-1 TaxID=2560057 RepID=UPI001073033B|nr:polyhydroxyalkanoic acid system family protein [Terasakiella sp. SH-1]
MSKIDLEVKHSLKQEEAASRLEAFLKEQGKYNKQLSNAVFEREGRLFRFTAKVKGFKIKGAVAALEHSIKAQIVLPLTARPFKGSAEQILREQLQKAMS